MILSRAVPAGSNCSATFTPVDSEVVAGRCRVGSWRTVEADLAHTAEGADAGVSEIIAGHPISLVAQVLAVHRKPPGLVRRGIGQSRIEHCVGRLIGDTGNRVCDLAGAPI